MGPHVANYRGCPAYKDQAFRQHAVQNQVSYFLHSETNTPPSNIFNFTADQIVSLVTNVVIQVALPNLKHKCRPSPICQNRSQKQQKIFFSGVNIEGKDLFELRPVPTPPAPFVFNSTLVEKENAPLKASGILSKVTLTSLTSSSSSTKSTKTPRLGSQRKSSSKLSLRLNKTSTTKP